MRPEEDDMPTTAHTHERHTEAAHDQHHGEHDHHGHHHEMPTEGRALTVVALSATLHCLTGCAIGEVLGMVIGTALGFSEWGTVALAVGLAFLFGYGLTSLPLLRAGLALAAVIPIALASDTLSIATMEVVDNGIMLAIPGAMEAGVGSLLFWGSLSFALAVAGAVALPVNRWLIGRGKGHAVVHETGIHGGPSPRLVGVIAAVAFVFGSGVLVAEVVSSDGASGGHMANEQANRGHNAGSGATSEGDGEQGEAAGNAGGHNSAAEVRGLSVSDDGMTLALRQTELTRGERSRLEFQVVDDSGKPVRDFEVEHEKRMHFIVVRRDFTGFQHLHPTMRADGTWTASLTLDEPGSYRAYADFKRDRTNYTLAADFGVDGAVDWQALPAAKPTAQTASGYDVRLNAAAVRAGHEAELGFTVTRNGRPVTVEPYLGARGHLVALRQGDGAYLHVHPLDEKATGSGPVQFATEFPTAGRYRLFLQFQVDGRVHTAAFTQTVGS
jgi:Domain of unknown function (DUF4396)